MRRRLLFPAILRTRSARKILVWGSVIVHLGSAGCDKDPALPREPELPARDFASPESSRRGATSPSKELAREKEALEQLALEAGVDLTRDPTPPGGDLRHDIDSFTSLDACVRDHAVRDPIVADAVEALGYDTLVRDACRTLQALGAKSVKPCASIIASPLRQLCETQVAVYTGDGSLCPNVGGLQRDPTCLARARRDDRLCAAAGGVADQMTCRALVQGRESECGSDDDCRRRVERYRSLLEKPESHPPFARRIHVEMTTPPEAKESVQSTADLDDLAAGGAVLQILGDRIRLHVGTPKARRAGATADQEEARLMLEIALPAKALTPSADAKRKTTAAAELPLGAADLSFELALPKGPHLQGTTASERKVTVTPGGIAIGNPVRFTLTARVSDAPHTFLLKIDVETFVRDVVDTKSRSSRPGGGLP